MSIIIPEILYTQVNGHRLARIEHHNPEATHLPVIFIHGLTGSVRFWEAAMLPEVEQRHSWFSISLPLHFPSTYAGQYNETTLTESGFAQLMDEQLTEMLPQGKFILVGYSVGGFAALNYATKYPERVAAVVSIGGFASGKAKGLEGVLQFFSKGKLLRRFIFWSSWKILQSNILFLRLAVKFYAKKDRELQRFPALKATLQLIFPDVAKHDIKGMRYWFRTLLKMELRDELQKISCPALVFAGEADPIIPYQHQVNYVKQLQSVTFISLHGVGHVPFAEADGIFEPELVKFLAQFSK